MSGSARRRAQVDLGVSLRFGRGLRFGTRGLRIAAGAGLGAALRVGRVGWLEVGGGCGIHGVHAGGSRGSGARPRGLLVRAREFHLRHDAGGLDHGRGGFVGIEGSRCDARWRHRLRRLAPRNKGVESGAELCRGLVAKGRVLLERALEHRLETRRQVRCQLCEGGRRCVHVGLHEIEAALGREGHSTGEQRVEQDPQRVDVGARVGLLAANLFGRHELGRAHELSHLGHALGSQHAGDSEVHHLERAAALDHQVRALDVAVNDPALVGVTEAVQSLEEQRQAALERQARLRTQDLGERLTLDELHDHEQAEFVLHQAVEGGDVRVVEPGQRAGFGSKPAHQLRASRELGAKPLDGHAAIETQVDGPEDLADTALAELLLDPVLVDGLADHPNRRREDATHFAVSERTRLVGGGGAQAHTRPSVNTTGMRHAVSEDPSASLKATGAVSEGPGIGRAGPGAPKSDARTATCTAETSCRPEPGPRLPARVQDSGPALSPPPQARWRELRTGGTELPQPRSSTGSVPVLGGA